MGHKVRSGWYLTLLSPGNWGMLATSQRGMHSPTWKLLHYLSKRLLSPQWMVLPRLSKPLDHRYIALLNFQFHLLVYMFILMPVPCCLNYCSFAVSFKIKKCEPFNFVPFWYSFSSSESLPFPYKFRIKSPISAKSDSILVEIALNL